MVTAVMVVTVITACHAGHGSHVSHVGVGSGDVEIQHRFGVQIGYFTQLSTHRLRVGRRNGSGRDAPKVWDAVLLQAVR